MYICNIYYNKILIEEFYIFEEFSLSSYHIHSFNNLDIINITYIHFIFILISIFSNYGCMITHLQETWKIQNKVTYSFTKYYNFLK